jgi:hypothetical protein
VKLRAGITEAASEVKDTAARIGSSVQWNTAALVAVTVVSVVALIVATAALNRSTK